MRIVMDFDGIYTDPSDEGEACSKHFRDKILSLQLKQIGLETLEKVESWLGELRARQAKEPFQFGWRSEGRVSAFTFEDPFIRNIGLADFLDHLANTGDEKAKVVLAGLSKQEKIKTFGELSEWAFHQLNLKKRPDPGAKRWVENAIKAGHEVTIVSNSATDKIEEFLIQNQFAPEFRPKVRGGARKFGLGKDPRTIIINETTEDGAIRIDTDRPEYEKALMEIQPDAVIGDVFCLDLTLPIRLKREGKLAFKWGIFYRHRDYTPSRMIDMVTGRGSKVPEVTVIREWDQFNLPS
jgi:phosphoglycolate phosphatase-like HAD superfamily hydrolase